MPYIWQRADWPRWRWDATALAAPLAAIEREQLFLEGSARALGDDHLKTLATEFMTQETVATAAIESIRLDPAAVRSSVMRRLGLAVPKDRANVAGPDVKGLIDVLADSIENRGPLTEDRLHRWHESLFPRGYAGLVPVLAGAFRGAAAPMQIVSGPAGRETVHFEAPPAAALTEEMPRFLHWFNEDGRSLAGPLRACVAHLWFETLHPFEDGNGRIGRAILDLAIAQGTHAPHPSTARLWSVSHVFRERRKDYYKELEAAQKGDLDITRWLDWSLRCVSDAHRQAQDVVTRTHRIARFWLRIADLPLNSRQRKGLKTFLDANDPDLEWITTRAYARITGFPKITAARDLAQLTALGVIAPDPGAGGRSTRYRVVLEQAVGRNRKS